MVTVTENKRVKIAYILCVAVLAFQVIDVFFLHNNESFLVTNIVSRIFGILLAMSVSAVMRLSLKRFCFKSYGWFFDVLHGVVFSVLPILIVYTSKYFYFRYRGYENLVLTFRPSGMANDLNSDKFMFYLLLYIATLLIISVFKEVFYRGFLITQLSGKYGVYKSIVIQSVIYTISFVPTFVNYIITGKFDSQGPIMTVFLICGHLFYNFLAGFKWGMFYKVNGTVWMSVTDHFLTNFILSSFFFTDNRLPEKWYIIEVVAVEILSVIISVPFYMRRDKMNEIAAAEYALSKEAMKMGVDTYSPSMVRKRIDGLLNQRDAFADGHKIADEESIFEEPVSLNVVDMPTQEDLTLSVRGYAIDDSQFNYNTQVDNHDSEPSERSKAFFNKYMGSSSEENAEQDNNNDTSDNAEGISKLVSEYFNENFNRHTFTKK